MPIVIPGNRCNTIALIKSQLVQRIRELLRPLDGLADRATVTGIVGRDRDDFPIPVKPGGVLCNRGDEQRGVHHESVHCRSPFHWSAQILLAVPALDGRTDRCRDN